MEVKHRHIPGKAALARSTKIKGSYKRQERMVKDDILLKELPIHTQSGGEGSFQFERNLEQESLLKTFQEGIFSLFAE